MVDLNTLEPQIVWKHFEDIRHIPRSSKNEEGMRKYVKGIAEGNGCTWKQDAIGNVVVTKPASPGKENIPVTILQSHLDMVCEKDPDIEHDFEKDSIKVKKEGDYLYAIGTTLGADNGIGVALALAVIAKKDWEHGAIECLFTIDEETGLTGAQELDGSILQGRRLINLDTEEHGLIYVGCAGGGDSIITFPIQNEKKSENSKCLEVKISGLKGGHSGCEIHIGKGNAIKILARILWSLHDECSVRLNSIHGGDKHNAIPRNCSALITVDDSSYDSFKKECVAKFNNIKDEFGDIEPEMKISVAGTDFSEVLAADASSKMLMLLVALPHGVLAMNPDIKELVNTSNNLAKVRCENGIGLVQTSSRSSLNEALKSTRELVEACARMVGAEVEQEPTYSGWKPDLSSPIVNLVKEEYTKEFGKEPEIKAIHAGLECGVIGEKVPGMDMVSIGPQIEFPHSPGERVHIASVGEFWEVLCKIIVRLSA